MHISNRILCLLRSKFILFSHFEKQQFKIESLSILLQFSHFQSQAKLALQSLKLLLPKKEDIGWLFFDTANMLCVRIPSHIQLEETMIKKRQPAKSFLDISNTYVKVTPTLNPPQTHSLLRRKSQRLLNIIKNQAKLKENQGQTPKICCLPPPRVQRSGSEVFNRTMDSKDLKELQSFGSLNTSTVTPPLTKRFQRKSQKKMEVDLTSVKQKLATIGSQQMKPSEEQTRFQIQNRKLSQRCERLQNENLRLKQQLEQKDRRLGMLSSALKEKENQLRKITETLKQREAMSKQLQQTLTSRGKLMSKLQQKSTHLESKLAQLKRAKPLSAQQADFNDKMNLVMERLRYREMEVHILKKEIFEIRETEKRLKAVLKENDQLKERVKYLVRKKYTVEIDGGSTSSLSYSCLSFTPDQI